MQRLRHTVQTIVRYRELYHVPREHVYFTTVVSRPNVEHLSALIEMAYELDLPKVILFPIVIDPVHPWHLRQDIEAVHRGLQAAHEAADRLGVVLQLGAALDDSLRLLEDVKSLCMHPWAYALIDYTGRVGFCDHLIGNPKHTLGSLQHHTFREIWNGKKFQMLRAAHTQQQLPDQFSACRWCYQMRYIDFEHQIHPSYASKIVSNRTRVQLYRKGIPIEPVPEFH